MDKEEHTNKDFQVFTQEMLIKNYSILRTILQNQMVILKTLSKNDKSFGKEINDQLLINIKYTEKMVKDFPTHKDMEVPLVNKEPNN